MKEASFAEKTALLPNLAKLAVQKFVTVFVKIFSICVEVALQKPFTYFVAIAVITASDIITITVATVVIKLITVFIVFAKAKEKDYLANYSVDCSADCLADYLVYLLKVVNWFEIL